MKNLMLLLFVIISLKSFSQINSPNGDNIFYYNGAADVTFRYAGRGAGGRAFVHAPNNILALNYEEDFIGGTMIGNNVYFKDGGNSFIYSGNLGIGTANPSSKLDVRGIISTPEIAFRNADGGDDSDPYRLRKVQGSSNNNWLELQLNDDGDESFRIYGNSCEGAGCGEYSNNLYHSFDTQGNVFHKGNVGIGITNPTDKLAVDGRIHSQEVKVDMNGWSDFVFKKEYQLQTLEEVEKHIKEKGHLENIPSEKEVLKYGINLGEMNAKLLQKIEEMTLYMIEMKKQIQSQNQEIQKLKSK